MKRRELIRIVTLSAIGTGTLLSGSASAFTIPPEKYPKKILRVGGTRRFEGGALTITFLAVLKDQRCPINAMCISAGDAAILLRVKAGKQKARIVTLHTEKEPTRVIIPAKFPEGVAGVPKSYSIGIASLSPLPEAGKKRRQSDYRLELDIETAV